MDLRAHHESLAAQIRDLLTAGTHPLLANTGQNNPHKHTVSSNYCPITCLATTGKILSGIIISKLSEDMSTAQNSIGNNTRGSKQKLMVDRAVHQPN